MSLPFDFTSLPSPTDSWGPSAKIPSTFGFNNVPYAPFSKSDKLGKAADWQQAKEVEDAKNLKGGLKPKRDQYHAYGASAASSFAAERNDDDGEFSVVDNTSSTAAKQQVVLKGRKTTFNKQPTQNKGGFNQAANRQNNPNNRFQQNRYNRYNKDDNQAKPRDPSVKVTNAWGLITDIEFNKLTKLKLDVAAGETVDSYGTVNYYTKKFEQLKPGFSQPLTVLDRAIFNPTTQDDPIIKELASKKAANIFATDSILAQLMCAARSVYSWDIVITKKNGCIFLDKRDEADRYDVDENSPKPPADLSETDLNNAENLQLEATYINHNFVANSVDPSTSYKLTHPENPFVSSSEVSDPLLSRAYSYKKFNLPSNEPEGEPISVIVRTEFDAVAKIGSEDAKLSVHALNQYVPQAFDWKQKLNQQRGAIVASELKKNNNKISRWTTKALLAGCDQMKIGFVARTNTKVNSKHVVLGVATYKPTDLSSQINLTLSNGWGVVKSVIDIIEHDTKTEDWKYVILKDPNSQKISIFSVPLDTFENDDKAEKEGDW